MIYLDDYGFVRKETDRNGNIIFIRNKKENRWNK
jgi:hypothetical protein